MSAECETTTAHMKTQVTVAVSGWVSVRDDSEQSTRAGLARYSATRVLLQATEASVVGVSCMSGSTDNCTAGASPRTTVSVTSSTHHSLLVVLCSSALIGLCVGLERHPSGCSGEQVVNMTVAVHLAVVDWSWCSSKRNAHDRW